MSQSSPFRPVPAYNSPIQRVLVLLIELLLLVQEPGGTTADSPSSIMTLTLVTSYGVP